MFLASFTASAQIVTSKKEALKKGIYSYSEQAAQSDVVTPKPAAKRAPAEVTAERPLIVTDNDLALLTTGKPLAAEPEDTTKEVGPATTESPLKKKSIVDAAEIDTDFEADTTPYLALQIVNNAMQFEGVRYRGGGTTKDGMDCSGMVFATFKIFDITLPRSSHEMAKAGREVQITEVKKGDLLFFDNNGTKRGINHVGLVTDITPEGEVKFLHSATHGGVMVSSLNEPYYDRTFVQANRVVEN